MVGWSFVAGAGFVLFAWVVFATLRGWRLGWAALNPVGLWEGKDKRFSISKVQLFLWLLVLGWAFMTVWVARMITAENIAVSPVGDVPESVLGILGFSVGTTVVAKGITSAYASSGEMKKADAAANERGPANLVEDDSGVPDLYKFQLLMFTLLALIVYVPTVFDTVLSADKTSLSSLAETLGRDATEKDKLELFKLPDMDEALLFLMGISSTAYIGKKLVTRDKPIVSLIAPQKIKSEMQFRVLGSGFGSPPTGTIPPSGAVTLGSWQSGVNLEIIQWTDSEIIVKAPPGLLDEGAKGPQTLIVFVAGAVSDPRSVEVYD